MQPKRSSKPAQGKQKSSKAKAKTGKSEEDDVFLPPPRMKYTIQPPETAVDIKMEIEEAFRTEQEDELSLPEKRATEEIIDEVPDLQPLRHAQNVEKMVRKNHPEAFRVVEALTEEA